MVYDGACTTPSGGGGESMMASAVKNLQWRQRPFGAIARHASRYGVGPLAVFEAPQHRGTADLERVVATERDHVADGVVELDRRHPAADHGARVRASLNTYGTRHTRSITRRPREHVVRLGGEVPPYPHQHPVAIGRPRVSNTPKGLRGL